MMHIPKLASESTEKIIVLFVSWFLADLDLHEYLSDVPTISPSATTLKDIMAEDDIDTVFFEWEEMKGLTLTLICDKGNVEKRRDDVSFVKLVSRYDKKNDWLKFTCISIQSASNFSTDIAQGVDHALIPYNSDDNRIILYGQGVDAGGGGTRKYLDDKLNRCMRVKNYDEYVYTTCSFHDINVTL